MSNCRGVPWCRRHAHLSAVAPEAFWLHKSFVIARPSDDFSAAIIAFLQNIWQRTNLQFPYVVIVDRGYLKKAMLLCWSPGWRHLRHSRNVPESSGPSWGSNGAPAAASFSGPLLEEDLDDSTMVQS